MYVLIHQKIMAKISRSWVDKEAIREAVEEYVSKNKIRNQC